MNSSGGDLFLNNSFGIKPTYYSCGKRCHSLNNSADFGNRFHTSFLDGEFNNSVKFARSTHKTKSTKTMIQNQTKFFGNSASPFLEEMYLKYSKNLQKYFSRNKEGMKLYGNKYFENISIDTFLKTRGQSQQKMLAKIRNPTIISYPAHNTLVNESEGMNDEKIFPTTLINTSINMNSSKGYVNTNLNINDELDDDEFFLTPLPNKSRKLLNTKKEKKEFLHAERAAVMMRTFEYTHGVRSKVGFSQYRRMLEEEKEKLISLMCKAANKIQTWWKKKKSSKNSITEKDSEENDSEISKKYSEYFLLLEKKRKENLISKIIQYINKINIVNKEFFMEKFKQYAKTCKKYKKIRYMKDWFNNMFFCIEKRFQIFSAKKPKKLPTKRPFYVTKKTYYDRFSDYETENNKNYINENNKGSNFKAQEDISETSQYVTKPKEISMLNNQIQSNEKINEHKKDNQKKKTIQNQLIYPSSINTFKTDKKDKDEIKIDPEKNKFNGIKINEKEDKQTIDNNNKFDKLEKQKKNINFESEKETIDIIRPASDISEKNQKEEPYLQNFQNTKTNSNENKDSEKKEKARNEKEEEKINVINYGVQGLNNKENMGSNQLNISKINTESKNIITKALGVNNQNKSHKNSKAKLSYYDQIERVIMLQRCIKNFLNYQKYKRMNEVREKTFRDSFGFLKDPNPTVSQELYGRRNSNLRKSIKGFNQLQLIKNVMDSFSRNNIFHHDSKNKITEELEESKDSEDKDNLCNYDANNLDSVQQGKIMRNAHRDNQDGVLSLSNYKGGSSNLKKNINMKNDLKNLNISIGKDKNISIASSTKNKKKEKPSSVVVPKRSYSNSKSKSKSKAKAFSKDKSKSIQENQSQQKLQLQNPKQAEESIVQQSIHEDQQEKHSTTISKMEPLQKKDNSLNSSKSTSSKVGTNYSTSTSASNLQVMKSNITNVIKNGEEVKKCPQYQKPPLSTNSKLIQNPKTSREKLQQNKITGSKIISSAKGDSKLKISSDQRINEKNENNNNKNKDFNTRQSIQNESIENNNDNIMKTKKIEKRNISNSFLSTNCSHKNNDSNSITNPISSYCNSEMNYSSTGVIPPFQIFPQSYFNFIVKPCAVQSSSFVSKIRKKIFCSNLSTKLAKVITIKRKNVSKKYTSKVYIYFQNWKAGSINFFIKKKELMKVILKFDKKKIINEYFQRWKIKNDLVYHFAELIKLHVIKENKDFLISSLQSENKTEIYSYSHKITSVSTALYNNNQSQHFRYYCKVNKSNNENDFLIIRMSLGYKLLRQVFTRGLGHELLIKLKRRRRRNKKSKTHYGLGKLSSKRHYEFLNFNSKLLMTTKKIVTKKFFCDFYHRFLYLALQANDNIEYNLENNEVCGLIREGYRKGYFQILYNILKIRFNNFYDETEMSFEDFVGKILTLK